MTENTVPAVNRLTVYGTSWCPDVRRSRSLLDKAGIHYRYVDLDQDQDATELVRRLQDGERRIPTLVWPNGFWLVEPSDRELADRLDVASAAGR